MKEKTESKEDLKGKKGGFQKGQSGNPAGRPQGSRNKATLAAQALLEGEAERITRKAINLALKGNRHALKLCISRLIPLCRERAISVKLPTIEKLEQLPELTAALIKAAGQGKITPGEASSLASLITAHARSIEIMEFEKRLAALEASQAKKGSSVL